MKTLLRAFLLIQAVLFFQTLEIHAQVFNRTNQLIGTGAFVNKISSPFLNITSPGGNEVWQIYSTHNITWNCVDDGNLKIEITTDNGTSWLTLVNSIQASMGCYNFTVPPFPNSTNCKIKLTSLSYNSTSISNNPFTITSETISNITISSPNSMIKWQAGSTHTITWSCFGNVQNVKLEYTTNNGNSWYTIVASTTSIYPASFNWDVPNIFSSSCRIRISDASNPLVNDVSDTMFTIEQLGVVLPGGGEIWKALTTHNITWTSTLINNVNIYYSSNGGVGSWTLITSNFSAATGSYSWYVPNISTGICRIKIQDASDANIYTISNPSVQIWQPIQSIVTPPTGQITRIFVGTNISISAFIIASAAITVTYYYLETPLAGVLPEGVVTSSQYYWLISSPSISFMNGAISVPVSTLTGVNDATKLIWLKRENSGDPWINIGGTITGGSLVSTAAFSSFSEFAIGSTGADPLPIELNSFNCVSENNKVILNWATSTELNSSGFEVQKCIDNVNWIKSTFIKGSGNSNSPKKYSYSDNHMNSGKYQYRLKMIDNDGSFKYSSIVEAVIGAPKEYSLSQNYPNPFNPSTKIEYTLPSNGHVRLQIYSVTGQLVKTLTDENQDAGYYSIDFNGSKLSTGMYIYRLSVDNKNYVKKMLFLK